MLLQRSKIASITAACVALVTGVFWACSVLAHGGSHGSSGASAPQTSRAAPTVRRNPAAKQNLDNYRQLDKLIGNSSPNQRGLQPLYGGLVSATYGYFFEVVYTPQETRIYTYSQAQQPLETRGIRGEVVMQVNGNPSPFRYPIKEATDARGRVYGSVAVNVTRIRDGDMQVTFRLEGLPLKEERNAQFTQTFALTRLPVQVTQVRLTEADRPLIKQQRMCPVMDEELGGHGDVIKLMVGNQPLFVCCKGCIEEVQKNPQKYLRMVTATHPKQQAPPQPQVSVFWAAPADDAAIRAQRICPVMNQPLGEHGKPIKVVIDGRPIFVCCQGCVEKVVQNRDAYFRKVAGATVSRQVVTPPRQQAPPRRNITVSWATEADRPAIQAQGDCPVMEKPLGGHGAPIKIAIDGRPVFVCCKGCIAKVQQNPELYLSKVVRSQQLGAYSKTNALPYQTTQPTAGGSCSSGKGQGASCH